MLELFQFQISNTDSQPEAFDDGFGLSNRRCGKIATSNQSNIRSSCDVLDSEVYTSFTKSHPLLTSIYTNCQQIRSRINQSNLTVEENDIRNKWAQDNKQDITQTLQHIKSQYRQDLVDNSISKNYIRTLSIDSKTKVILIGDIHGSIHTLLRHMFRFAVMGIMNIKTMKIKKNYKLVFLGDAVDRGIGSLEVVAIIFKLIEINMNRVFYNRGNHETQFINERDGFKLELQHRKVINLYKPINEFFELLPCAIVLKLTRACKKVWVSHGAFEKQFLLKEHKLDFTDAYIPFDLEHQDVIGTMWHDFKQEGPEDSERGEFIVNFDSYDLTRFLDVNDLDFIIRGHQDFSSNSYLFGPEFFDGQTTLCGYGLNYFPTTHIRGKKDIVVFNPLTDPEHTNKIRGSIAIVYVDKKRFWKEKGKHPFYYATVEGERDTSDNPMIVFPCLTISTNTDYLRYLNFDSFAVLSS